MPDDAYDNVMEIMLDRVRVCKEAIRADEAELDEPKAREVVPNVTAVGRLEKQVFANRAVLAELETLTYQFQNELADDESEAES